MNPKDIHICDYSYDLPDERIAKYPLAERDQSKLLVYDGGNIQTQHFADLPSLLPQGSLIVMNNTRVIRARLRFHKRSGAQIEIFLLEPLLPADYEQNFQTRRQCSWLCMIGNLKKWHDEQLVMQVSPQLTLTAVRAGGTGQGGSLQVDFQWTTDHSFAEVIEAVGELPIPPYLSRRTEQSDLRTYQTVYSKIKGSVAAPTAGLHFTPSVLQALDRRGIERQELTLHVGAGTFKPVKSADMGGHEMHSEYICVTRQVLQALLRHRCQTTAVGTTSVRTLESLYYIGAKIEHNPDIDEGQLHVGQWEPYDASCPHAITPEGAIENILAWLDRHQLEALHTSTQIIIAPGYRYKLVRALVTNFHQPRSTLLLLVSAFIGDDWQRVYRYALDNDYRFLSYGDSSLLIPRTNS
ncbi:MAG: S-adenosylmethionine:tRNA ribosyltransferase-isomerase [Prevotella sp.]|nr:S-adenosylmethionine:tRNA ribosyltransferase-isomerase [Prevotella sp.]